MVGQIYLIELCVYIYNIKMVTALVVPVVWEVMGTDPAKLGV